MRSTMDPVYLDYAATTPVREEVLAAMTPYETEDFGNPSSLHRWGRRAAAGLEEARAEVASLLGAQPAEIAFVRGGTESDNLATIGRCMALREEGHDPLLAVSAVEHPAVIEAAERAAAAGLAETVVLGVSPQGRIDLDSLRARVGPATLASVMWANNETGIVLPVPEVAALVRGAGGTVHTDASQALGKVPVDTNAVDLLTATGHKIYGPKGTGILYRRRGTSVSPLLHGGGQERALRPGTEDVGGAVGFAVALRLAEAAREREGVRMGTLRQRLERELSSRLHGVRVNGGEAVRAPHVCSIGFDRIPDGPSLIMALDLAGVAVSGGSACASGSQKGSHVIEALYGAGDPYATVRYSFGLQSTEADVDRAVEATVSAVQRIRDAA